MNGISAFLKKYLDFTPPEKAIIRATVQALQEILGEEFQEGGISFKNGVITTAGASSVMKSEIRFNKTKILARVGELTHLQVSDIS